MIVFAFGYDSQVRAREGELRNRATNPASVSGSAGQQQTQPAADSEPAGTDHGQRHIRATERISIPYGFASTPPLSIDGQNVYASGLGMNAMESRPAYSLEPVDGGTKLHLIAEGELYGIFKLMKPYVAMRAREERTRTVNALKRSLESSIS